MINAVKASSRHLAMAAADTAGRHSAARRVLPTLLIVGGQRCGTTALFKALRQHRSFRGPTLRKGVHYFDVSWNNSLEWYRAHFPTQRAVRRAERLGGGTVVIAESSPYYLWHPRAAERIATSLPGVRVIALLRDPVERAYSAHAHELARGYETEPFERALELESSRLDGEVDRLVQGEIERSFAHQHLAYIRRGEYVDQVVRMEQAVGRDNMLVLDSADLWAAPESVWPKISTFLGLADQAVSLQRHNARGRSPMSRQLRAQLTDHFTPFDERLAKWWGREPSWRR